MQLPYGYWLSSLGKIVTVNAAGGHTVGAIDLLGDKFVCALEMSWLRIVCDKAKQTIYYEHGDHARPFPIQMSKLKELAQDAEFKLVCDNTGREVDIYETKKKLSKADKLLERPFQQAKLAWSLPRQAPQKRLKYPSRMTTFTETEYYVGHAPTKHTPNTEKALTCGR